MSKTFDPKKPFKFYSDARHGWLAVKKSLLIELGIEDEITYFSFEKGNTVYLEEDGDASTFAEAFEERFGIELKTESIDHGDRSPVQSYPQYRPPKKDVIELPTSGTPL